ncbi:MAG: hypothetical protein JSS50_03635 [Proteobacteria bacterium]|nr:hypothetical protein [Pseudomonadota bacterium]
MKKNSMLSLFMILALTGCVHDMYYSAPESAPKQIVMEMQEGNIRLAQLIDASSEIAISRPSKYTNRAVTGQIIKINGRKYEVRYFGFEDSGDKLAPTITFRDYIYMNNLSDMKSMAMDPLPGMHFESFDYRRAKLKDGVYFSMAIKRIGSE